MEILCWDRGTGKTTELIRKCEKYRYAVIVCPTQKQAEYIFKNAYKIGANIPMPIDIFDFVEGKFFYRNIDAFLFDDLDCCLRALSKGVPIDSVAFNADDCEVVDEQTEKKVDGDDTDGNG